MRLVRLFFVATLCIFTSSVHLSYAQSQETMMQNFFSYNDNQAYWWLSKFAHPMNEFRSGYCEMSGSNVYVTINSSSYTTRFRLHKNGSVFDSIETLEDTDWAEAFVATNIAKDLIIKFWRDYSSDTVSRIISIFGDLNIISSEQMCLAVLTVLFWKYPNNASSSNSDSNLISGNNYQVYKLNGSIDNRYPITMSITIKGKYVEGSYYYKSQGPNKKLTLMGILEDGLMLLYEENEDGEQTGRFLGSFSNGLYQGQFTTNGKEMPFTISQ